MTGFATGSADTPRGRLSVELRSVNARFLDLQFRIADELRAVEPALRELLQARLARGKVDCRVFFADSDPVALWTGIVPRDRAGRIVERLLGRQMFSGWGVRTLATPERRYNPMSYHNGSVWPHDTAIAAVGMRRYGLAEPFITSSHFKKESNSDKWRPSPCTAS